MNIYQKISIGCIALLSPLTANAQWEVKAGAGAAVPLVEYSSIVKTGWLLQVEIMNRLKGLKGVSLGAEIHAAYMLQDKDPADDHQNSRLTIAPVLFTASYSYPVTNKISPYITAGAGVAAYTFLHGTSPDMMIFRSSAEFAVSPQLGVACKVYKKLSLEVEGSILWYPEAYVAGYKSLAAGLKYRL